MGLFTVKRRACTSSMSAAEFKELRKEYRRTTGSEVRLPMFGTKTADDADYTKDLLLQRADFAKFLTEVSHGSKVVAVRQSYTDCDGFSGEWWHVIPAHLSAYRALEQRCEDGSDGTFSLYPMRDEAVFKFAPQHVRDRIASGQ